ncbi:MAG: zinc dependent phospholipase C family protein [Candidatus Bathyarchaeota archaeon]|nr:zinc dependent phospholipase C family protein [Candidatus Bathyarchaeota archaeon]
MLHKCSAVFILAVILCAFLMTSAGCLNALAWSNGGYTCDVAQPGYGTHDWIAEHALDWLPAEEKRFLVENLEWYLYGTELPDNKNTPNGVGDTAKHHIYFAYDGILVDDSAAVRAKEEYTAAQKAFNEGNLSATAIHLGMVVHYVTDVAVFGHVMGAATPWGSEEHHSDYESYVLEKTKSYGGEFANFLVHDNTLTLITAYEATVSLARDTTFDAGQRGLNCTWMDQHYNWNDSDFRSRVGESLSLATNAAADVLYTFYSETAIPEFPLSGNILAFLFAIVLVCAILLRAKRVFR